MLATPTEEQLLVDFFHSGVRQTYAKNEYINGPDETPRGVFYIESGFVKSYDITKYGEENLLIIRKAGEIIGLTWAITGQIKPIINRALVPTSVWLVSREQFHGFIRNHPEGSPPIIDTLTNMYRLHSERIMTLEYRTVRERLTSFLLTMAGRFGVESTAGLTINVPLKQQDIASSISATRETTSRALMSLQQSDIIMVEQSLITVRDREALAAIIS